MSTERRERVLELAVELGALTFGDFILTSGQRSSYYFDGRLISLDAEGAALLGAEFLEVVLQAGASAIGGLTLGADPIVASVAVTSHHAGTPVRAFIVRKDPKEHGMGRRIEGPLAAGASVVIVDDACSTGGSLFSAIEAAEAEGCTVAHVAAIIDRHQGGSDEIRRRGYAFTALLESGEDGAVRVVEG